MLNTKFFDELSAKLSEVIRNSPAKDIEKNARALLMQGFAKLDLITREEFDVQAQLLTLTREQLVLLEMRVAQLEAQRQETRQAAEVWADRVEVAARGSDDLREVELGRVTGCGYQIDSELSAPNRQPVSWLRKIGDDVGNQNPGCGCGCPAGNGCGGQCGPY